MDPDMDGVDAIMKRGTLPGVGLEWALQTATRSVPVDAVAPGRTLLTHRLAIHAVEGHRPGLYRWDNGVLQPHAAGEEEEIRELSSFLCLGQPLAGDAAYTMFGCSDLETVLGALGPRGYRAAHVEAGIVNGRLLLAAHALGHGATGLTFFDDQVRAAFAVPMGCLLATAVGVPAYRPTPGGWPRHPVRLAHYDSLMVRLEGRFRQSTG
jgi:hypothetical protein